MISRVKTPFSLDEIASVIVIKTLYSCNFRACVNHTTNKLRAVYTTSITWATASLCLSSKEDTSAFNFKITSCRSAT